MNRTIATLCLIGAACGGSGGGGPTSPSPIAAAPTVVVNAFPLWTDAQLSVSAGDTVTITASGRWSWGDAIVGPDGGPRPDRDVFQEFDGNDKGRLIGFIGPDPYQGHYPDQGFFPQRAGYLSIGSSTTFTAHASGRLWLGFNDDAASGTTVDNSGSVTAVITITRLARAGT
jgi:hypothetical protein